MFRWTVRPFFWWKMKFQIETSKKIVDTSSRLRIRMGLGMLNKKSKLFLGFKQDIWRAVDLNHPLTQNWFSWIRLCLEDFSRGQAIVGFHLSARGNADVPKRSTKVRIWCVFKGFHKKKVQKVDYKKPYRLDLLCLFWWFKSWWSPNKPMTTCSLARTHSGLWIIFCSSFSAWSIKCRSYNLLDQICIINTLSCYKETLTLS